GLLPRSGTYRGIRPEGSTELRWAGPELHKADRKAGERNESRYHQGILRTIFGRRSADRIRGSLKNAKKARHENPGSRYSPYGFSSGTASCEHATGIQFRS